MLNDLALTNQKKFGLSIEFLTLRNTVLILSAEDKLKGT